MIAAREGDDVGRKGTLHAVLDERVENDPQRARAHSGRIRLPSGSQVANGARDCLADRLRGADDHRRARDRQGRMGSAADTRHDERGSRGIRKAERRLAGTLAGAAAGALGGIAGVLRPSAAGLADGVELPLRHRSSSRSDYDLPAADGIEGAADLRSKRRRTVANAPIKTLVLFTIVGRAAREGASRSMSNPLGRVVSTAIMGFALLTAAHPFAQTSRTLVAVFAHPDDETSAAPALARYAREGVQVYLVIATDGAAGGSSTSIPRGPELARARAEEAACAATALGAQPPILLGFPDAQLGNSAD